MPYQRNGDLRENQENHRDLEAMRSRALLFVAAGRSSTGSRHRMKRRARCLQVYGVTDACNITGRWNS